MNEIKLKLVSVHDIKTFVEKVCRYDMDIDLSSGRYVVDAKSIMGIFSLDLANPVTLTAHGDDCQELFKDLEEFLV